MSSITSHVYHHLRPEDGKRAAIFCENYGEAGAIDFFGPKLGLPPAISGHQNYSLWGPRDCTGEVILALDTNDEDEHKLFASVEDLGQVVSSPVGNALRAATSHLSLSRFEDQRSGTLAARKELVVTPSILSRSVSRGVYPLAGDSFDQLRI
jgi:hypothetical protein